MGAPAGIFRAIFFIDGEEVGRDAKVIPGGEALTRITASVPVNLRAGLFAGVSAHVEVRVEFEPGVMPYTKPGAGE